MELANNAPNFTLFLKIVKTAFHVIVVLMKFAAKKDNVMSVPNTKLFKLQDQIVEENA